MSQKIRYVKHPLSPEEKAAICTAGYKIVDIKFKPDDLEAEPVKPVKKPVRRRTRAKKAE